MSDVQFELTFDDLQEQGNELAKKNARIGFVGKVTLTPGALAPYVPLELKDNLFAPMRTQFLNDAVADAIKNATGVLDKAPVIADGYLQIKVIETLANNPQFSGAYVGMASKDNAGKEAFKFVGAHCSPEVKMNGKEYWVHISAQRVTKEYGGDMSKKSGDVDPRTGKEVSMFGEFAPIITFIENKKAAQKLVDNLRNETVTVDQLLMARGYNRKAVNELIYGEGVDPDVPRLTDCGQLTLENYHTVEALFKKDNYDFFAGEYEASKDIDQASTTTGCSAGDLAVILGVKEYFTSKLGDKPTSDDIIKLASDTGMNEVVGPKDLANFLGLEPPF